MTIATTKTGHKITYAEAYKELKDRQDKYIDRYNDIGYITFDSTPMWSRVVRVKVGCKQRAAALQETIGCLILVETAVLNNEEVPTRCLKRVRRSLSHIFGALRKEEQL